MPAQRSGAVSARSTSRHARHRFARHHRVLGVPPSNVMPVIFAFSQLMKRPFRRRCTRSMAAVPAHSHPLASLPRGDAGAHGVDAPGDLVARHARQRQAGNAPASPWRRWADAARLTLIRTCPGPARECPLHQLERTSGFRHLDGFHLWHGALLAAHANAGFAAPLVRRRPASMPPMAKTDSGGASAPAAAAAGSPAGDSERPSAFAFLARQHQSIGLPDRVRQVASGRCLEADQDRTVNRGSAVSRRTAPASAAAISDCSSGSTRTTSAPGSCGLTQTNDLPPAIFEAGLSVRVASSAFVAGAPMRRTSIQLATRDLRSKCWRSNTKRGRACRRKSSQRRMMYPEHLPGEQHRGGPPG